LERMLAAGRLPAGANRREEDVHLSGSNPAW
jgi:hypothetical protein